MAAKPRTPRDQRRRSLGQNFLRPEFADGLVAEAGIRDHDLVVDVGAGTGAITLALARRGAEVVAVERDPVWASRLRERTEELGSRVNVVCADFLAVRLPSRPFRVVGSLPFGATTAILRRLLDDPRLPLERADVVVQWEVACKRAAVPPSTLLSTLWAPWWEFRLGPRVPRQRFRPVPQVDAGVLTIRRRSPPLLPAAMAGPYAAFVRKCWPFPTLQR